MKVTPPSSPSPLYPALAKAAALVAVSCAVSACQQHPKFRGEVPFFPDRMAASPEKKDAGHTTCVEKAGPAKPVSAKEKPLMIGRVRTESEFQEQKMQGIKLELLEKKIQDMEAKSSAIHS